MAAVFVYAPIDRLQGPVQRVFYLHLALAWNAYLAFTVVLVASVAYLVKGDDRWDRLGRASDLGYLMLRTYVTDQRRGARFAAVLGILGFLDIPIVHQAVTWWRGMHPESSIGRAMAGVESMPATVVHTLLLSLVAFVVFFCWLLQRRYQLECLRAELELELERREE
jgi:heme exporter protein C